MPAHGGGALPAPVPRLSAYEGLWSKAGLWSAQYCWAHFLYHSLTYCPAVLRMPAESVGESRLMYGTDQPFAAAENWALKEIARQTG